MIQQLDLIVASFLSEKEASAELTQKTGIAVSVVQADTVRYQGCFGLRDRKRNLPVTPETVFPVLSLTKALTATAVLVAMERGGLKLDTPVNSAKELIKLKDPDVTAQLTLAHILSHRTGLPAHDLLWYFGPDNIQDLAAKIEHLALIPGGFGKDFVYSNIMYGTIDLVMQHAVGERWDSFVTREILKPVGMDGSIVGRASPNRPDNFALPYIGTQEIPGKEPNAIAPAGSLRTTLEDMNRWVMFQLRGCTTATGKRMLSEDSVRLMRTPHTAIENAGPFLLRGLEWLGNKLAYGYGWFLGELEGRRVIFHTGFLDGYSSVVVLFPDEALGFTVMTNANMSAIPGQLAHRLAENLIGVTRPVATESTPAGAAATAETQVAFARPTVAGVYRNPAYGDIEILERSAGFVLKIRDAEWPLELQNPAQATVMGTALGVTLPIPAFFELEGNRAIKVSLPFSFDPRVPLETFVLSRA